MSPHYLGSYDSESLCKIVLFPLRLLCEKIFKNKLGSSRSDVAVLKGRKWPEITYLGAKSPFRAWHMVSLDQTPRA